MASRETAIEHRDSWSIGWGSGYSCEILNVCLKHIYFKAVTRRKIHQANITVV